MRILASIIPLLLLGGVRADDGRPTNTDRCDYTKKIRCGDQCLLGAVSCYCGSDTDYFYPSRTDEHCCLELGESCYRHWTNYGVCYEGRRLSMSSACNTTTGPRCYNSYQHNPWDLGIQAHYTCPNTCVPWREMCRGVSWCEGDHQVCGPELRCPQYYDRNYGLNLQNVPKLSISSSLVSGHHYCIGDPRIKLTNDGQFYSIDRSDETRVIAAQSPLDLNISSFTPCNATGDYNSDPGPGLMCGRDCRRSDLWCRDDEADTCDTGSGIVWTNNEALCRDPRVWANVSCSFYYYDGRVEHHGLRCTGQNMECVTPWYTVSNGELLSVTQTLSVTVILIVNQEKMRNCQYAKINF